MMNLDRTRQFGKISPPLEEGVMRPAHFEQEGMLFDAQGFRADQPRERQDEPAPAETPRSYGIADLLAEVDAMPFKTWHMHAKRILGTTCPPGKAATVVALRAAQAKIEERSARRSVPRRPDRVEAPEQSASGGINLAAWGRGKADYLFAEVRKAIRERYNRVAMTEADAVDVLLDEKIITFAEAREVLRPEVK